MIEVMEQKRVEEGSWDSNNIINVSFKTDNHDVIEVEYNLTTTIILQINLNKIFVTSGDVSLCGTVTRNVSVIVFIFQI